MEGAMLHGMHYKIWKKNNNNNKKGLMETNTIRLLTRW